MKILVTGANGQLGHDVIYELAARGHEGIGSGSSAAYHGVADGSAAAVGPYVQMDITDEAEVRAVLEKIRPDGVIHCAAWTAVDAAEDEENQPKVQAVNVLGTRNIAQACKDLDAKMLYISTDYVFNGQGMEPWKADCRTFVPLNVYGRSKLKGNWRSKKCWRSTLSSGSPGYLG